MYNTQAGTNNKLPYSQGFCDIGLWSISAHPNYACEQAIWVTFFFFSGAGSGNWINVSAIGCILLMLLFQGSADFSEEVTLKKYPEYSKYLKRVGRFLPKLF
jgi:steroid 5-alpha reductase family enzyme